MKSDRRAGYIQLNCKISCNLLQVTVHINSIRIRVHKKSSVDSDLTVLRISSYKMTDDEEQIMIVMTALLE